MLDTPIAPVFSLHWLRTQSRQTPIGIKQDGDAALPPPWWRLPPQRNVGAKPCPKGFVHTTVAATRGANPWLARGLGDRSQVSRWRRRNVQSLPWVSLQSQLLAHYPSPNPSSKASLHVEWLLLAQHVVAGARELVRQRLRRDDGVGLRPLALERSVSPGG